MLIGEVAAAAGATPMIGSLTARRHHLVRRLDAGAARTFRLETPAMTDYTVLPDNLPVPEDDGAADHLTGLAMPALTLPASDGSTVDLAALGPGRTTVLGPNDWSPMGVDP